MNVRQAGLISRASSATVADFPNAARLFSAILLIAVHGFVSLASAHAQQPTLPPQAAQPIHIVRWNNSLNNASAPAGAHLNYYGGPVISNVQIVLVYWGPNVATVVTTGMPGFYQGVLNSSFFDLLSEYSSNVTPSGGGAGTNQSIGRGSYVGATVITPSITATSITDAQIQTELISQINSGHLSAPQYDLNGNVNTEYMIYFPPGLTITQGGSGSCVAGGFCAYHGTALFNSKFLPYGVIPDFGPGSGCATGCGNGTEFQNLTSVSSHELAESVTDIAVGQATVLAPPLAWYDGTNGEIGDICNAQQATINTPTGTYVIQQEFSNALANCVATGLHPTYQLTAPAGAVAGVPFNITVTAQNPSGGHGTDTSFIGTIHFTSTDGAATLPSDYLFASSDQGVHTFSATLQNVSSSITATDTVNGAITATTTFTATNDFSISASPTTVSIQRGNSGTSTISTSVLAGSAQTINLTVAGVPSGATTSFNPASVNAGSSSTLTVNTGTAAAGNYVLIVTGTEGSITHTTSVSISVTQAPAITSAASTTFAIGAAGSFTVTATGSPAPTFSETGTLPSGVSFSTAGVLSGTPAAGTGGTYPITITASNGTSPNATQNFTLTVSQGPAITSANSTTFTAGTAGSFSVTATGSPAPTFSETGTLPSGVSFSTAGVLSGTPAAGTGGTYPITITASNGTSPNATQNFTLTVNEAPAITSAASATFTLGAAGSFSAKATGFPAPTFSETGVLPSGVTFSSTGVLSGTPAAGTGGTYPISITASNGVSPSATQNFTLTVNQAPAITSVASTAFTVGAAGSFAVTATGSPKPTFSETGTLPSGVTFSSTGVLSGTPAAGTGGTYPITITASNGTSPNATQNFTLTVNQAPAITSAASATFTLGVAGSFTVKATGFPAPTFSEAGALPSGVTFNGSTGLLSGTPTVAGSFPITITASNGTSPNATQNFTLTVPNFSISATPASVTTKTSTSFAVTLTSVGVSGNVTPVCTGNPAGSTCSFSPSTVLVNGTAQTTANVAISKKTNHGTFTLTFSGTLGGVTSSTNVILTVR